MIKLDDNWHIADQFKGLISADTDTLAVIHTPCGGEYPRYRSTVIAIISGFHRTIGNYEDRDTEAQCDECGLYVPEEIKNKIKFMYAKR